MATSAIGAGLGASGALGGITNNIVGQAIAGNVVSQGLGIITGAQKGFSWAGVAAAAIAAPITSSLNQSIKTSAFSLSSPLNAGIAGAVAGVATSTVNELTRVAIVGGKMSWENVAIGGIQGGIYGYAEGLGNQGSVSAVVAQQRQAQGNITPLDEISSNDIDSQDVRGNIRLSDAQKAKLNAQWDEGIESAMARQQFEWSDVTNWVPGGLELDSTTNRSNTTVYPISIMEDGGVLTDGFVTADEFGFEQTGGVRSRAARGPFELSENVRARSAFDAFSGLDPTGTFEAYRDTVDAISVLNRAEKMSAIAKLKNSIGMSGFEIPSVGQLGVSPQMDGNGNIRYDLGEELNAYRDAKRLIDLHRTGEIELDFNNYKIKSIGTAKLTPAQFSAEIEARYSNAFKDGVEAANVRYKEGTLRFPIDMPEQLQKGLFADNFAKGQVNAYVTSIGVTEGPGQLISLNRWSYDPMGTGLYTRPDVLMNLDRGVVSVLDGKAMLYKDILSSSSIRMQFDNYYRYGATTVKAVTHTGSYLYPRTSTGKLR